MPRNPNHVRIAFGDPISPGNEIELTERRFAPSLLGWRQAEEAVRSYMASEHVEHNSLAWPVLVVPAEDDRAIKTLRRIVAAVIRLRQDPDAEAQQALDAELAKALLLLPIWELR